MEITEELKGQIREVFVGFVDAGITWLNSHGPDNWFNDVNPDRLKMDDCHACVIGQSLGNYNAFFNLRDKVIDDEGTCLHPSRLGFNVSEIAVMDALPFSNVPEGVIYKYVNRYGFTILEDVWVERLNALRMAAV